MICSLETTVLPNSCLGEDPKNFAPDGRGKITRCTEQDDIVLSVDIRRISERLIGARDASRSLRREADDEREVPRLHGASSRIAGEGCCSPPIEPQSQLLVLMVA